VLAAGEGKRLRPLTLTRPKCMLPVGNKPLLEHLLLNLKKCGITDVILVVGYKKKHVTDYFGSGAPLGIKIEYADQGELSGTASALNTVKDLIDDELFLVVYGDVLIDDKALNALLKNADEEKAIVASVPVDNPKKYGILKLKDNKVVRIIEKPRGKKIKENLANAGAYILPLDIFKKIEAIRKSPRGEFELTDGINALIKGGRDVITVQISPKKWIDIGYPWDLLKANELFLNEAKLNIDGYVENRATIHGNVGLHKESKILSGARVEGPTLIDSGCTIGPNCYIRPYTSIGRNVKIGNCCEIKNCIIMDNTKIAHLSYVADSIIGQSCNFGAGTIVANLRFDESSIKMSIENKKVDTHLRKFGVVLGDNVKTGINVSFMPGVKVGPNSWIGAGSVVFHDIPPSTHVFPSQSLKTKPI
jgi:bifunctional UDP-N-acetylglucosamine pyrophosphorylase/glucosamine-1-phosphate N-acetyltransferase